MKSLKCWISIFIASLLGYGSSLYFSSQQLLIEGRYIARIQGYSKANGQWRERIEVSLNREQIESTISVEGDGLEGVALFALSGEVTQSENGAFELSYSTEPIQTSKVIDGYHAVTYTSLFLSGKSNNVLVYQNEDIVMLEGTRGAVMLTRSENSMLR
ncbi:hypothetical protein OH460_25735 [Vibrio sp. Makdt]|uniref:hypothetical protein n=1 Tax=Vibrio sp. Makdt TaxID=2998828 RepID=UPI0022CD9120|nr:hypothetical protein [Vibrio sp. Makdt]MDA0155724.1 hypothetical protein [Vibrio sp. Makdt]CAH7150298.1 conserved hypothetical protein [Vibrio chagasii]